ncbi:MAG TPA: hypothetical protein VN088_07420 [Nocardioides sp.]|nr:hypothetical protein [Nocardioides sp.]
MTVRHHRTDLDERHHLVLRFAATVVVLLTIAVVVGGVVGVLLTQLVDQAIAALGF